MHARQVFTVLAAVFVIAIVGLIVVPGPAAEIQATAAEAQDHPKERRVQAETDAAPAAAQPAEDLPSVTRPPQEQPQLELPDLEPGKPAPQFVVVSFDGGVESRNGIMKHYNELAREVDGHFSFYVSGVYLLPDGHEDEYHPPRHSVGSSDIGFSDPSLVGPRISKLTEAYNDGNEIGTHFMGHFCTSPVSSNGVTLWKQQDWTSEIEQFNKVLDNWRTYSPQVHAEPLPFDSSVIKGGRTPCLQGEADQFTPAFKAAGYRYDSSGIGWLQWPKADADGFWSLPMPVIQVPGIGKVTAMDYNFMVNQNDGKTEASPEKCKQIEDQSYQAYADALRAVENGNRAPLLLGNHMNDWVCNAYTNALTRFVRDTHERDEDIRFISALDLINWMERQDPALLAHVQAQPIQEQPIPAR